MSDRRNIQQTEGQGIGSLNARQLGLLRDAVRVALLSCPMSPRTPYEAEVKSDLQAVMTCVEGLREQPQLPLATWDEIPPDMLPYEDIPCPECGQKRSLHEPDFGWCPQPPISA